MQIQSLSASRFWITSLKPVYENGARPDSSGDVQWICWTQRNHKASTFEFWKKHVFKRSHCAIFKIFIFGWQSFSAPDLVQVDDLNERRFLEVFDMRVRQAAIRGWIYRLVKGNIWTGNHGSPHQIEWRFVWKTSLKPIQCIFWGMTFISTSYFRVNRNVSRLLPTASFSWIQLFVYLEDLDPAKLYGMYVQKNIP